MMQIVSLSSKEIVYSILSLHIPMVLNSVAVPGVVKLMCPDLYLNGQNRNASQNRA